MNLDGWRAIPAEQQPTVDQPVSSADGWTAIPAPAPMQPVDPATRTWWERNFADPFNRSVQTRQSGARIAAADLGLYDVDDAIAGLETDARQAAMSPMQPDDIAFGQELQEAGSLGEAFGTVLDYPSATGRMIVEQIPNIAGTLAGGVTGLAAGTALGGPVGGMVGAATGGAAVGGVIEYTAAVQEKLLEQGLSVDAGQLEQLLQDPEVMGEARRYAATRAGTIGVVDALSAGVIGRLAGPIASGLTGGARRAVAPSVARVAAARTAGVGAEAATQAGFGMAGERLAQITSGGEENWGEVLLEGLLEVPGSAGEMASVLANLRQPMTDTDADIDQVIDMEQLANPPSSPVAQAAANMIPPEQGPANAIPQAAPLPAQPGPQPTPTVPPSFVSTDASGEEAPVAPIPAGAEIGGGLDVRPVVAPQAPQGFAVEQAPVSAVPSQQPSAAPQAPDAQLQPQPAPQAPPAQDVQTPSVEPVSGSSVINNEASVSNVGQNDPQTRTPEFQQWFGQSRVVDEQGSPQVVYHGTAGEAFTTFNPGSSPSLPVDGAIWFGNTPDPANDIAISREQAAGQTDSRVIPAYLSMQNPLVVDAEGQHAADVRGIKNAMADGYDGVILRNVREFGSENLTTSYAVFRPEQIKSATGNSGAFNPDDPNILRDQAPPASSAGAQPVSEDTPGTIAPETPETATAAPDAQETPTAESEPPSGPDIGVARQPVGLKSKYKDEYQGARADTLEYLGVDEADAEKMSHQQEIDLLTKDIKERFQFASVHIEEEHNEGNAQIAKALFGFHRAMREMAYLLNLPLGAMGLFGTIKLNLLEAYYTAGGRTMGSVDSATGTIMNLNGTDAASFQHEWTHALDSYLHKQLNDKGLEGLLTRELGTRGRHMKNRLRELSWLEASFINLMNEMTMDPESMQEYIDRLQKAIKDGDGVHDVARALLWSLQSGRSIEHSKGTGIRSSDYRLDSEDWGEGAGGPQFADYQQKSYELLARAVDQYLQHKAIQAGYEQADLVTKSVASGDMSQRNFPQGAEKARIHLALENFFTEMANHDLFNHQPKAKDPAEENQFDSAAYGKQVAAERDSLGSSVSKEWGWVMQQYRKLKQTGIFKWLTDAFKNGTSLAGIPTNLQRGMFRDAALGLFQSKKGRMSSIERKNAKAIGVWALKFLRDRLTDRPGTGKFTGRDYESVAEHETKAGAWRIEQALKANKLWNPVMGRVDPEAGKRIYNWMIDHPDKHQATRAERAVARVMRDEFKRAYKRAEKAGVQMGFVDYAGYMNREMNNRAVNEANKDPKARKKLLQAFQFAQEEWFDQEIGEWSHEDIVSATKPFRADSFDTNSMYDQRIADAYKKYSDARRASEDKDSDDMVAELRGDLLELLRAPYSKMRAEAWVRGIVSGNAMDFTSAGPGADSTKKRALPKGVEEYLRDYLNTDPVSLSLNYLRSMNQSAAYTERFGQTSGTSTLDQILNRDENKNVSTIKYNPRTPKGREAILRDLADPSKDNILQLALDEAGNGGVDMDDVTEFKGLFDKVTGRVNTRYSPPLDRSVSMIYMYQIVMLSRVMWTAFAEPATILLRNDGDFDAAGAAFASYAKQLGSIIRSSDDTAEMARIAGEIGLINGAIFDSVLANRLDMDFHQPIAGQQLVARFMRHGAMLTPLTNMQNIAAMRGHHVHLRNLARAVTDKAFAKKHGYTDGKLEARLNEYKIPAHKHQQFAEWILQDKFDRMVTDDELSTEMGDYYKWAIIHGVDTTIQNPFRVDKSPYAEDTFGRLVFGLLSFIFKFTQEVYGRAIAEEKRYAEELQKSGKSKLAAHAIATAEQGRTLAYGFAFLIAGQFISSTLREAIFSPERWEEMEEEDEWMAWMTKLAISRSGIFGPADPLINAMTGLRYERDLTSLTAGPALGYILNNIANVTKGTLPNLPWIGESLEAAGLGGRNSPNTLAAEHTAAKSFYRLVFSPGFAYGMMMLPIPGPISQVGVAAGQQMLTSPAAATAFADALVPNQ